VNSPHERGRFVFNEGMSRMTLIALLLVAGTAGADPKPTVPTAAPAVASSAPSTGSSSTPSTVIAPLLLTDMPVLPVPSLRLEAIRIAGERFDLDWRYPEPGPLFGSEGGQWFIGYGHYRPLTKRSAALHTGSIAATMVGEILMAADSPLAGVGALITGATLDAAAADVDRDAESRGH
jgi:hypothetical protein